MSNPATSVSQNKGRGKNKRFWTTSEDQVLVDSLLELHRDPKWKADTGFRSGYLKKIEEMMKDKLPNCGVQASPHIKSRIKTLKGKYGALADARNQSGFAWDEEKMMLVCERSVFEEWAKNKKDANGLYNKPFEHYYALAEIYGKDRATEQNAGNAEDDEEELRPQDTNIGDDFFPQMNMDPANYGGFQFGHTVELDDDYETVVQPSPQSANAQVRAKQVRSAQEVAGAPNKARKKAKAMDDMAKNFGMMSKAILGIAPQFAGLVDVLSTEKQIANLQGKLREELKKFEFLNPAQVFQITNKLAKEHDLLRVFFAMTDEDKREYIISLVQYGDL